MNWPIDKSGHKLPIRQRIRTREGRLGWLVGVDSDGQGRCSVMWDDRGGYYDWGQGVNELEFLADEPLVHSHLSDCLPSSHPLAHKQVHCDKCDGIVHAGNNECMQTWFEFEEANVCAQCMGTLPKVLWSVPP
jgi:hypothetical protein